MKHYSHRESGVVDVHEPELEPHNPYLEVYFGLNVMMFCIKHDGLCTENHRPCLTQPTRGATKHERQQHRWERAMARPVGKVDAGLSLPEPEPEGSDVFLMATGTFGMFHAPAAAPGSDLH